MCEKSGPVLEICNSHIRRCRKAIRVSKYAVLYLD